MPQWAAGNDLSIDLFYLRLGGIESAEVRWWAAILAPVCGLHATLDRDGKKYYSP
jgi:hypothetical protein